MTRYQVAGTTVFDGAEGAWFGDGVVHFTTKGTNQVWAYDGATETISVVYDVKTTCNPGCAASTTSPASPSGDIYVAEDGGDMQVVLLGDDGSVSPFLQVLGQDTSELTGLAFTPAATGSTSARSAAARARPASRTRSPARFARNVAVASTVRVRHTPSHARLTPDHRLLCSGCVSHRPQVSAAARYHGHHSPASHVHLYRCCRCRRRARCRTRPPRRSSPGHTTRSRASGRRAARRCRPRGCSPIPAVPRPSRICWPPTQPVADPLPQRHGYRRAFSRRSSRPPGM